MLLASSTRCSALAIVLLAAPVLSGCQKGFNAVGDAVSRTLLRSSEDTSAPIKLANRPPNLRPGPAPAPAPPVVMPQESAEQAATLQEAQQATAVWAAQSMGGSLRPVESGAGLVVCEPVMASGAAKPDANLAAFGAGCARWLYLHAGGQGELGKTPLWGSVDDVRIEMKKSDLRLNAAQALQLGRALGATHVAAGRLSGTAANCTLSYEVRPVQGAAGAPLAISGTPAQIVAALPGLARRISAALSVPGTSVPTTVGASAAQLSVLGQAAWKARSGIIGGADPRLQALAKRLPLAGVLLMRSATLADTDPLWRVAVKDLLAQAPANTLVLADIGRQAPWAAAGFGPAVDSALRRFPNNYALAIASMNRYRDLDQRAAERQSAMQAVRCAPLSALAWVELSNTIFNEANDVRQKRYINQMSRAELRQVKQLYPFCRETALQATRLDPLDARAWLQVSNAAAFNGEEPLAEAAFWRSLRLDPDDREIYWWGLQLYQPKWFDSSDKLLQVALLAEKHDKAFDRVHQDALWALMKQPSLSGESQAMLMRALERYRARIRRNPRDAMAHLYLAFLAKNNSAGDSQVPTAIDEFETYLKLRPRDASVHYQVGRLLHYKQRTYNKAEQHYRKALALGPTYAAALNSLGDITYYVRHDAQAAERLYRRAIALQSDGLYHVELARLLLDQDKRDEALAEANKAIALGFTDSNDAFTRLGLNPR